MTRGSGPRARGWIAAVAAAVLAVAAAHGLVAQSQSTEIHIKFTSGQSVVPIFEGWERVPDGSFDMVFGYMNRNHVEELSLPIGTANNFDPGAADRGQPAYFYPRENHFIFKVNVPKDWDRKKELVWTLTAHGKTEQARATLLDIWEIDRKVEVSNGGGGAGGGVLTSNELIYQDEPPKVTVDAVSRAIVGAPITLTAHVTDDGIPPPNAKRRAQRELEPSLKPTGLPSPVNVPLPQRPRPPQGGGLSVLWLVYRGPAGVTFDPEGYMKVTDGKAAAKATFKEPGTYVIRAFAHDGLLRAPADITVAVDGSKPSER